MPIRLVLFIVTTILLVLLAGFPGVAVAQTDTPEISQEETPVPPTDEPEPEKTNPPADEPTITPQFLESPTPTPSPTQAATVSDEGDEPQSTKQLFTIVGPVSQWVSDLASQYGWDQIFFLGLSVEDWINLALSILFFVLIYISGKWLINRGLREVFKRASIEAGEEFLKLIKSQINWLVITIASQLGLARLTFLSLELRIILNQVFFIAYLTIIAIILWKAVGFGSEVILRRNRTEEDVKRLQPIYMVVRRLFEALLIVGYFSIMLSYFGIDITAFAAALGIGGLAISLAAQDTLADAIAGFLILIDQPFRVGDRIEISGLGTWGDVVEIGTRSTRIRTRDNRLVIVPNSAIAKDQVVNYTYPDPRYRVTTDIGVAYGSDFDQMRKVIEDTLRGIEGVLSDKPVDIFFLKFGDSSRLVRVR